MSRVHPGIAERDKMIEMYRKRLDNRLQPPQDIPMVGCGDGSCIMPRVHGGQHTNGGCRCDDRALRTAVQWLSRRVAFLEETVRIMRDGPDTYGEVVTCPECKREVAAGDRFIQYHDAAPPLRGLCKGSKQEVKP